MTGYRNIKLNILAAFIKYRTMLIFILLFLVISVLSPYFLSFNNLINVLRQISVYGVIGVGFTLIIASGNLDFSVGGMITLIGIITAKLSKLPDMPFAIVVLVAIASGALLGLLNGLLGILLKVPLFITTFAMAKVYEGVGYLITKMATISRIPNEFTFIGQGYIGPIPIPVYIMIIFAVVFGIMTNRTKFGRYALAIGGNSEAARITGINVQATRTRIFMTMGICNAFAALIITGRAASAQPTSGLGMEMDALTAVVIGGTSLTGGKAKMLGTIIGCLVVGVINNGLNLIGVDSNWQVVAKGLMILIAVFLDVRTESFFNKRINKLSAM